MNYFKEIKLKILQLNKEEQLIDIFNSKDKVYSYVNPYVYVRLKENKSLIDFFDGIYLDGFLMVYLYRLIGVRTIRLSCDMTSILKHLFDYSVANKKTIYFIGSTKENIVKSVLNIKKVFPELNVIHFRDGFFSGVEEIKEECNKIAFMNPDFLLVGMGTPHQEEFIKYVKQSDYKGVSFTCGGFFHQTVNGIDYYPKFIDKYNLRWLYRMVDERRVFIRTIKYYPLFIFLFIYDLILSKFK